MNWPISWQNVKDHIDDIDDIEDGINPELLPKGGVGYTETVKTVVYEKAEVPFLPHEGTLNIAQIVDEQKNVAVFPGMVLTVHYDGADYKCVLVKTDEETLYFGNIPTGNEWNESGMPFMGMVFVKHGLANITIMVNDTAESHIIGISISTETIHPIDPKYLVKTIELDKYGIGDAILALFAAGGGMQEVEGVGTFWDDVATSSVLRIVQPYADVVFEVDQCVRMRRLNDYSDVKALNFNFMASMGAGEVYTLYVSIDRTTVDGVPGASVYMKVT